MSRKLFRKDFLEQLSSPEELQERLIIVSFKSWIALGIVAILLIVALSWSVLARIPVLAEGKVIVFDPEPSSGKGGQTIYGIIPFEMGSQIKVGMPARMDLASVDVSKYGHLAGVVEEIFPYLTPIEQTPLKIIPSHELQGYLAERTVFVIIKIRPTPDPTTFTKYQWTTKEGPPFPILEGTLGSVKVVLDKKRPISFLIPALQ